MRMRSQVLLVLLVAVARCSASRPNVLLVVGDDYGWNDIGYHQNAVSSANPTGEQTTNVVLKTPILDRLASEGRIGPNVIRPSHPYGMPGDEIFLGSKMKEAGYDTHMVGKWHLGLCDERYTPTFRGFNSFTGYLLGAEDYFNHTRSDSGFAALDFRNSTSLESSGKLPPACTDAKGVYSTDVFTAAVELIVNKRESDKPLFVYMPFQSVHGPLQAPQKYIDLYPPSMDKARRTYAGMVSAMDAAVGRLESIFMHAGIWNETVLIFTTDNGGPLGSANNFPLRGHKATCWEGGVRGIAFVRSYAKGFEVPAGTTTTDLMHSTDWFPTLSSVAGFSLNGTKGPIDGVDQWDVISRAGAVTTRKFVIHNSPGSSVKERGGGIRGTQYKLLFESAGGKDSDGMQVPSNTPQTPPPGFEDTKDVCPPPNPFEGKWLFDIINDPRECTNLASTHLDILNALQSKFDEHHAVSVDDLALKHDKSDPASNPKKRHDGAWGPWSSRSSECKWDGPD